jgi:predicted DNA-binding transcriptional regulator AlpA
VQQLLTKRAAAQKIGVHPEHMMRLARAGQFPKPIKLGDAEKSAVRFIEAEIDAWLQDRMARRSA